MEDGYGVMKLIKIAAACAALGLAAWAPAPAVAVPTEGPQASVRLAQYVVVPYRHRHWRHRYFRHHHYVYVY